MVSNLIITLIAAGLLILLDWRDIRSMSKPAKWLTFSTLAVSSAIWIYITTLIEFFKPIDVLMKWLGTIIPIK